MGGGNLDDPMIGALSNWVRTIPAPPSPSWVDGAAAGRGRALFEGPAGCSACHSGPRLTNNATVNVGTGGSLPVLTDNMLTDNTMMNVGSGGPPAAQHDATSFQVPPLVGVGWRTPLLHDGCAATIADRFGKCATPAHGSTAQLSAQDVSDLSAYLESL
jgi:cytochrome c peroxidase